MNVRSSLLSTVAVLGILLGAGGAAAQAVAPPAAQEIRADGRTTLSAGLADAGQPVVELEGVRVMVEGQSRAAIGADQLPEGQDRGVLDRLED